MRRRVAMFPAGPFEARLSALVAIREDIERVKGRNKAAAWES
jgi:hypothetical protein